ncbi:ceramide kinase-like [Argonauta hians]
MSLEVNNDGLTWITLNGQTEKIPFADVINICHQDETSATPINQKDKANSLEASTPVKLSIKKEASEVEELGPTDDNKCTLVLTYIKHGAQRLMSLSESHFTMTWQKSKEILNNTNEKLKTFNRPKNLLVLINPYSGKGLATKVFSSIKYIFELAGIKCHTSTLSKTVDLTNIIQNQDLSQFDGVVVVGGDGTLNYTVTSLMKDNQKNSSIKTDDDPSQQQQQSFPLNIGIIPAGTGNVMLKMLHGTDDITTATLHIVKGSYRSSNMYSIYQGGILSTYSFLIMGFGFSGEIIKCSLSKKWMGSGKYLYSTMACLLRKRHSMKMKFSYKLNQDSQGPCEINEDINTANNANKNDLAWKTIEGDIQGLDSFLVSFVESSPSIKHSFGEKSGQIFIIKKCSFSEHLKFYSHMGSKNPAMFHMNSVECVQMSSCKIELTDPQLTTSRKVYMNCDGELLTITSKFIDIRFHYHGLKFFTSPD